MVYLFHNSGFQTLRSINTPYLLKKNNILINNKNYFDYNFRCVSTELESK